MKKGDLTILEMNNKNAFELIYKSYYSDLLNFANSYVMNRDVSEDIVQDVFCKLWDNIKSIRKVSNIKSYLFTIVKNNCLNYFKHRAVEHHNQDKVIEAIIFSETYIFLEDISYETELIELLKSLPEKQRAVIELKYFEKMKYSDISNKLDISTETVQTHLKRAVKSLKNNFPSFYNKLLIFLLHCVPNFVMLLSYD